MPVLLSVCAMPVLWSVETDGSVSLLLHPVFPLLCASAAVLTSLGCVFVVCLPPGPVEGSELVFISTRIKAHCGVATLVLGCGAHFVAFTQYIVAAHIGRQDAAIFVMLELLGWYVVLAYQATGLIVHLCGLGLFLVSTQLLHHAIAQHPLYFSKLYARVNSGAWLFAFVFAVALPFSENGFDERGRLLATNLCVSLEYILLTTFAIQNICMAGGLNRLQSIHLVFQAA